MHSELNIARHCYKFFCAYKSYPALFTAFVNAHKYSHMRYDMWSIYYRKQICRPQELNMQGEKMWHEMSEIENERMKIAWSTGGEITCTFHHVNSTGGYITCHSIPLSASSIFIHEFCLNFAVSDKPRRSPYQILYTEHFSDTNAADFLCHYQVAITQSSSGTKFKTLQVSRHRSVFSTHELSMQPDGKWLVSRALWRSVDGKLARTHDKSQVQEDFHRTASKSSASSLELLQRLNNMLCWTIPPH